MDLINTRNSSSTRVKKNTPLTVVHNLSTHQVGSIEVKNILDNWLFSAEVAEMSRSRDVRCWWLNKVLRYVCEHIKYLSDFNWENYCRIQHQITDGQNPKSTSLKHRLLVQSLYLYACRTIADVKVQHSLQQYKHLFIGVECRQRTIARDLPSYVLGDLQTNFPLSSHAHQIISVKYVLESNKVNDAHFFAKTDNVELHNILKGFLEERASIEPKVLVTVDYRLFVLEFENSLCGHAIHGISSFNETTYSIQLKYFNDWILKCGWNEEQHDVRLTTALNKFYLYIDNVNNELTGQRLFNSVKFNMDIIRVKGFQKAILENYHVCSRNILEQLPEDNKWLLVPQNPNRVSNIQTNGYVLLDFTKLVNPDLRADLKRYMWYSRYANKELKDVLNRLTTFLNAAHDFYAGGFNTVTARTTHGSPLVSQTFLIVYYTNFIFDNSYSSGTKNLTIAYIRSFLEFTKDKYELTSFTIKSLSYIDVEISGGTPLPEKDFRELVKEFRKNTDTADGELMFIILQLSFTTKLRIGEILTLHRDCIVSRDERSGIIKYYSKTSFGEMVHETLLAKDIQLIERALVLTHPAFESASKELKQFIFIAFDKRKRNRVTSISWSYKHTFRDISTRLYDEGKIEQRYTPYNARDTFIESAWQGVEDGTISLIEATAITGNTASTAIKHYRNRDNIQRYIEAIHGIYLADKDIAGQVVPDHPTVEEFPPVQENSGLCSSTDCIKQDTNLEDSEYICLTCPKFVTTVSRSGIFEQRLQDYSERRQNAQSQAEREFYTALMELNGLYLSKIYSLKGEMS